MISLFDSSATAYKFTDTGSAKRMHGFTSHPSGTITFNLL